MNTKATLISTGILISLLVGIFMYADILPHNACEYYTWREERILNKLPSAADYRNPGRYSARVLKAQHQTNAACYPNYHY